MKSITYYEGLDDEQRKAMIAEATTKGGGYPGWRPYCAKCSTMRRMDEESYG
ncbi:hypothetical protein [Spirosoma sordidisoli]|uniref:hypothetical protein n=1 Tax=Spirosoma sordidisoli TaxID=2502893 RepID=UPI0013EA87AA|nr:hypothetical protein [Spirosoma sordidisoli]